MKKVSYKKLWKILIDLDINKRELSRLASISTSTLTKLSKGECVNMDMLLKICTALDCDLHDIVEVIPDEATKSASSATILSFDSASSIRVSQ